jgi:hypothetical protein
MQTLRRICAHKPLATRPTLHYTTEIRRDGPWTPGARYGWKLQVSPCVKFQSLEIFNCSNLNKHLFYTSGGHKPKETSHYWLRQMFLRTSSQGSVQATQSVWQSTTVPFSRAPFIFVHFNMVYPQADLTPHLR